VVNDFLWFGDQVGTSFNNPLFAVVIDFMPGWAYNTTHGCHQCTAGHLLVRTPAAVNARAPGVCTPCAPGSFAEDGDTECRLCPRDTYQPAAGQTSCLACPGNSVSDFEGLGAAEASVCKCQVGFHSLTGDPNACIECPMGAKCDEVGTTVPEARPGWWTGGNGVFVQCLLGPAQCNGGLAGCTDAYKGRSCGDCAPRHYKLGYACMKCETGGPALLLLAGVLLFGLCGVLLLVAYRRRPGARFATIAIAFNAVQVLSLFEALQLDYPALTRLVLSYMSFFSFDVEFVSPECSFDTEIRFTDKFVMVMVLPVLAAGMFLAWLGIIYACQSALRRRAGPAHVDDDGVEAYGVGGDQEDKQARKVARATAGLKGADEAGEAGQRECLACMRRPMTRNELHAMRDASLRGYIMFVYLAYIGLASYAFKFFDCTSTLVDPATNEYALFLDVQPSIECYAGGHADLLGVALVCVLVYVIGIPAMMGYVFLRGKKFPDVFAIRYAFFAARYKQDYYYGELVLMLRKAVISAVVILLSRYAIMQAALTTSFLFLFTIWHTSVHPYRRKVHHHLETFSQVFTVFFLIFSQLLSFDVSLPENIFSMVQGLVSVVLIVCLVALGVAIVVDVFYYEKTHASKFKAEQSARLSRVRQRHSMSQRGSVQMRSDVAFDDDEEEDDLVPMETLPVDSVGPVSFTANDAFLSVPERSVT
jgi:hypothetical protein